MSPPYTGQVQISVADGQAGVVQVPSQKVQALVGCAAAGATGTVLATQSIATLQSTLQAGPLMEAAGLVVQAGGVVLAVRIPTVTNGLVNGSNQATSAISFFTGTTGSIVKVTYGGQTPHALQSGDVATIAGLTSTGAYVNGVWPVTVIDSSNFTIPVAVSGAAANSAGTVQYTGNKVGNVPTQTAVNYPYVYGTANDRYQFQIVGLNGFTVGATGGNGAVLVSLDRGTNFGAPQYPGAATTLALKDSGGYDTGLVLSLGATGFQWSGGGLVNGSAVGTYVQGSTTEPQPNDAGIASGIGALAAYVNNAAAPFPILQVVGKMASGDATFVESTGTACLDTLASSNIAFLRAIMSSRDASEPLAWGGSGEDETTWKNSVLSDMSGVIAKRVVMTGGYYNMPSPFVTQFASAPRYRRPFSFALGARQVGIDPQRHAGRVGGLQGGALSQITRAPSDLSDGWIYHDESANPAFDGYKAGATGRMASAATIPRKQGWFAANPLTLAPSGSDFQLLPRALVMDVVCNIVFGVLVNYVAADFTTKPNGTLTDSAANTIRGDISANIKQTMVGPGMISGFSVVVDQTQNINITNKLAVTVTIQGVAYLLEIDVTTGFASVLAAPAQV